MVRNVGSATGFVATINVACVGPAMKTIAGTVAAVGLLLERRRNR